MKQLHTADFAPAWWLRNAHAQTVWPTMKRPEVPINEYWERAVAPDGDYIDLVWDGDNWSDEKKPIVLILHGLTGNIDSSYSRGLMRSFSNHGFRPLFMHFPGCSGEPTPLPSTYHCGETKDVAFIVSYLKGRFPGVALYAMGVSLGANVLLKWLGETQSEQLQAAVAVSTPFNLDTVANCLMKGPSRLYQAWLISFLKQSIREKYKHHPAPFDLSRVESVKTFWEYDALITVPLYGFKSVQDYYNKAACRPHLPFIRTPTLIIHSLDDPFMNPSVIPKQSELSKTTELLITNHGGHVGFITGVVPGREEYWLESVVPKYFSYNLQTCK